MVQIPRANVSSNQLTTGTPSNEVRDIDNFTRNAQAIQRAGQVLGNVAEEFKRLDTLRQVSRSTVETNKQLTALEDKYLSDPNLSESSAAAYHAESQDIINTQLATIGDEEARLRTGVQFNGTALVKGFNIKKNGRTLDLQNAAIETTAVTEGYLKDSWAATTDEERGMIRGNLQIHYNNQIASRVIRQEDVLEDMVAFDENVRRGRATFQRQAMTAALPGRSIKERILGAELFIEQIRKGDVYPELTGDEQQEEVLKAQNFITRQGTIMKDEMEAEQRENFNKDLPDILSGKIQPEMVSERALGDYYDKTKASAAIKHLEDYKSPTAEGKENIHEIVKVRKRQLGLEDKEVWVTAEGEEVELGQRPDGTEKGLGYYGAIKNADGSISTEVSVEVEIDGKKHSIPMLVPGLSQVEIDAVVKAAQSVVTGDEAAIFQVAQEKAVAHAMQRINAGKNPFAEYGEQADPPVGVERVSVSKSTRDYNEDENITYIIEKTNGNFSVSKAAALAEKSFGEISDREKTVTANTLKVLSAQMTNVALNINTDTQFLEFTPKQIQATLDIWEAKFLDRVDRLETYDEEAVKKISDDIYREWLVAPESKGGMNLPGNAEDLSSTIMLKDGTMINLIGIDDSNVEATINLNKKK